MIYVERFSSSSVSVESGGSSASVHVPLWRSVSSDSSQPPAGPQLPAGVLHHAGLRAPGPPGAAARLPLHRPAVTGERQHQETSSGRVLTVTSRTSCFSSRLLVLSYKQTSGPMFCCVQMSEREPDVRLCSHSAVTHIVLFVLCRLTSLEACPVRTTQRVTACRPSCCTTSLLSRAAAPTPSRGRHNTSTSDHHKVNRL